MSDITSPEDEFEIAAQKYLTAVAEYKIAQNRYMEAVGLQRAMATFDLVANRICYIDSPPDRPIHRVITPQTEVDRRARLAIPIVDADGGQAL